ncbi:hypothetical protein [Dolichospermum sp. UHCC 0259]|nr:hypothetical protein [Dolichospermum sp. UHCC 0259]
MTSQESGVSTSASLSDQSGVRSQDEELENEELIGGAIIIL